MRSDSEDEDEDVGGSTHHAVALKNQRACEVRRVGDKKWRRFASRTDAAAAFPGLSGTDISKLINEADQGPAPACAACTRRATSVGGEPAVAASPRLARGGDSG